MKSTKATRILYTKNQFYVNMSMTAWKCYRCNLTFKQETHAIMHKDISRHSSRQIELVTA